MIKNALVKSNVRLPDLGKLAIVANLLFLFILISFQGYAQDIIRGKVTNRDGQPVQGISVMVKGTTNGTTTNSLGEFQLNGVANNATIVISSVGFETRELSASSVRQTSNIVLEQEVRALTDVVVTGFQNIRKKNFTGSAVSVKADEVKLEGIADISRMLEGRPAGVSVQNVSSTFGSAPKVRIRGAYVSYA